MARMKKILSPLILLMLALVPFAPEWKVWGAWVTTADILMLLTVAAAGWCSFSKEYRRSLSFPQLPYTGVLLFLLLLSVTGAILPAHVYKEFLKYLLLFAFFYATVNGMSRKGLLMIPPVLVVSAAVIALWFINDARMGNYTPWDRIWHRRGLWQYHMNGLGTLFVITIPFTAQLIAQFKQRLIRGAAMLALMLQIIALYLTYSRASWIALFAVASIYLMYRYKAKGLLFIGLFIMLPFFLMNRYYPEIGLKNRLYSIVYKNEGSIVSRKEHMLTAVEMMRKSPVTGIGLDNYQVTAKKYYNRDLTEMAHNMFLQFGAETGIASMIVLMLMMLIYYVNALKTLEAIRGDRELYEVLLFSILSFTGLLIAAQFGDPFTRTSKEYFIVLLAVPYAMKKLLPPAAV
jgi:hypothetical protein